MKVTTPEISWHERDPIYSVDIQPGTHKIRRLVSGGVDKFVRVWQIVTGTDGKIGVEFLANLKRHTKAVNVCRFSHDGEILATAGDDSVIIFWKLSNSDPNSFNIFQEDEEDNKENWCMQKVLRGHLEDIYDLCWSADGKYMISGSVDNSAILWDLTKDQKMALLNDHQSFVQGVAWDPKNEFAATLSTDRSCRVYSIATKSCIQNISKMSLPQKPVVNTSDKDIKDSKDTKDLKEVKDGKDVKDVKEVKEAKPKSFRMFHDDTMRSFFRRLTFTPDGELLIIPSGVMETDPVTNSTFIFTRNSYAKPSVYLPSPEKVTIAVRCCPIKFQLNQVLREQSEDKSNNNLKEWEKYDTLFELPYRMVFAVATEDSILLYDTQQQQPFGFITNVHYHQLSDLTWSSDGSYLVASSTDGYCTLVAFEAGELGVPYVEKENMDTNPLDADFTAIKTEDGKNEVTMETDQSNDDLQLVLDTSNDGSECKMEEERVKVTPSTETSMKPQPPCNKPLEMKVKSADGKLKNIQITTLSGVNAGPSKKSPPGVMQMKVKSADGTPKNVQITTLSTRNQSTSEVQKPPEIKVRSADGKPKKVQITTLATFSSPKSKQVNVENSNVSAKGDCKDVLTEKTDNVESAGKKEHLENKPIKSACHTPKQSKPSGDSATPKQSIPAEEKQTPKRVQVTTLQLFNSPSSSKKNKEEKA